MRFNYLIVSLIILQFLSCRKDEMITPEADYRDKLTGNYIGTFEYELTEPALKKEQMSDSIQKQYDEVLTKKEKVPGQTIRITKSKRQSDALIINGNKINLIPQSYSDNNNYSDVFLYTTNNCSGVESYLLEFYPEEETMIFRHNHSKTCGNIKNRQNSIFQGKKTD